MPVAVVDQLVALGVKLRRVARGDLVAWLSARVGDDDADFVVVVGFDDLRGLIDEDPGDTHERDSARDRVEDAVER